MLFLTELFIVIAGSAFFFPILALGLLVLSFCSERNRGIISLLVSATLLALVAARYPWMADTVIESPWIGLVVFIPYVVVGGAWAVFKWTLRVRKAREQFVQIKAQYLAEHKLPEDFLRVQTPDGDMDATRHKAALGMAILRSFHGSNLDNARSHSTLGSLRAQLESVLSTENAGRKQNRRHKGVAKPGADASEDGYVAPDDDTSTTVDFDQVVRAIKPSILESKEQVVLWIAYWPASMLWFAVLDFAIEVIEEVYGRLKAHLQAISDKAFANIT